jgi:hypothetical protein
MRHQKDAGVVLTLADQFAYTPPKGPGAGVRVGGKAARTATPLLFQDMPDGAWVALAATFLGGLIAVAGAWFNGRIQSTREHAPAGA